MWHAPLYAAKDKAASLFQFASICSLTFISAIGTRRNVLLLRLGWMIRRSTELECKSSCLGASPGGLDAVSQIFFFFFNILLLLFCSGMHRTRKLYWSSMRLCVSVLREERRICCMGVPWGVLPPTCCRTWLKENLHRKRPSEGQPRKQHALLRSRGRGAGGSDTTCPPRCRSSSSLSNGTWDPWRAKLYW